MADKDQSQKAPHRDILYDVPIEVLQPSDQIFDLFRKMGVTSVGDCVDFYERRNNATITADFGFIEAMETIKPQVEAKLKDIGYSLLLE